MVDVMKIPLLCAALLVLLYAGLSFNVSRMRILNRKGQVNDTELTKAVRAHGNASEYIPLFVLLLLYLSSKPTVFLDEIAIVLTISRGLHAVGIFKIANINQRHPFRFIGAVGTYISLFVLGGLLLMHAFSI